MIITYKLIHFIVFQLTRWTNHLVTIFSLTVYKHNHRQKRTQVSNLFLLANMAYSCMQPCSNKIINVLPACYGCWISYFVRVCTSRENNHGFVLLLKRLSHCRMVSWFIMTRCMQAGGQTSHFRNWTKVRILWNGNELSVLSNWLKSGIIDIRWVSDATHNHTTPTTNICYTTFSQFNNYNNIQPNKHLTLKAPIATNVVCFSRLLKYLRSLYNKQCRPRSDCSYRSSLVWIHAVCFDT